MKKERLKEIDIMRGISFCLVVVQHTLGGYSYSKNISIVNCIISRFLYIVAKVAVPSFICLTAISLFYTYYDKISFRNFYTKKIKFLICPYIICSILNLLMSRQDVFKNLIWNLIDGNAKYHLWYMGTIIRLYLIFPFILLLVRRLNKNKLYLKFVFLILSFISYLFILKNNNKISDFVCKLIFQNPNDFEKRFINITPLFWGLYFIIGIYIILDYNNFKEKILKYKFYVIASYIMSISYTYYIEIKDVLGNPFPYIKFNYAISVINNILGIMFFYIISVYITSWSKKGIFNLFQFISRYSYASYMLHIIVIEEFANIIPQTGNIYSSFEFLFVGIFVTTFFCYIISYLPYSEYIIGVKSKNKVCLKNRYDKHIKEVNSKNVEL